MLKMITKKSLISCVYALNMMSIINIPSRLLVLKMFWSMSNFDWSYHNECSVRMYSAWTWRYQLFYNNSHCIDVPKKFPFLYVLLVIGFNSSHLPKVMVLYFCFSWYSSWILSYGALLNSIFCYFLAGIGYEIE